LNAYVRGRIEQLLDLERGAAAAAEQNVYVDNLQGKRKPREDQKKSSRSEDPDFMASYTGSN
jgi:hypothetical protein